MIYKQLDVKTATPEMLIKLSTWHNMTPQLWMDHYEPSEEDILGSVKRMKTNDAYIGLVIQSDVLGFIWAERHVDHVMILSLYIEDHARNQNIATELKKI